MIEIRRYTKSNGKVPVDDWLKKLRDNKIRLRIQQRLRRVSLGNLVLCGGDKGTQNQDIEKAVEYLKDYENRTSFPQ